MRQAMSTLPSSTTCMRPQQRRWPLHLGSPVCRSLSGRLQTPLQEHALPGMRSRRGSPAGGLDLVRHMARHMYDPAHRMQSARMLLCCDFCDYQ